ncbi:MAG TPA: class IV adenylate cyclase [Gemmatimonadales bacterium]
MADELELKAVVQDPARTRERLKAAGAREVYRGMMRDRLFDSDGWLTAKGEVLRIRTFEPRGEPAHAIVGWKGPTLRSPDGYKLRQEIEYPTPDGANAARFLEALGYRVVRSIDRYVEVFSIAGATVRLEWYPRMDVLMEIEGTPAAIEAAAGQTGIPRAAFLADQLAVFVERYEARESHPAIVAEHDLGNATPSWHGL